MIFDIPQGDYSELVIVFSTKHDNNNIFVKGSYTNISGASIQLLFEFKDYDYFSVDGENDEDEATIVLDKNISASPLVLFDPVYLFFTVSNNMFENATLVDINGTQTILVNPSTNEDIFDQVVDRMEESTIVLW